jgi:hypothetical protein
VGGATKAVFGALADVDCPRQILEAHTSKSIERWLAATQDLDDLVSLLVPAGEVIDHHMGRQDGSVRHRDGRGVVDSGKTARLGAHVFDLVV